MRYLLISGFFLLISVLLVQCKKDPYTNEKEWREYLGGPDRNHYSTLDQINLSNVNQLQQVWEYHTKDSGQVQCNPIIVDGILYGMTAATQPFALNAATGEEIWRGKDTGTTVYSIVRGVVYWEDQNDKRILYTRQEWLHALDAITGQPILSFGDSGRVSLKTGLSETSKEKSVTSRTPGTVYEDLIIMPLSLSEGSDAALGNIQAFNIRTGKLAWVFRTIPEPGQLGYDSWPKDVYKNSNVGAANNWSGMSIDRKRGIVYVPTGSAAFDFYGGPRKGSNLFANTLLALDAKTGKLIWHFQFVHHDILDRDAPAPPNLVTITRDGKKVDAVAQVTKQAYVFLFNRENGEPIFPIEEVPVPASDIPGENAWPTQPRPSKPAPYARQTLTENDINPYATNREELLINFRKSRSEGPFTPLSKQGTIIFPGLDGGAEWGGAAVDPDGIMYLNSNEMGWLISLDKANEDKTIGLGRQVYNANCSSCHGSRREGNAASGFPSLVDIGNRMQRDQALNVITNGKGRMLAFKKLTVKEKQALVAFLFGDKEQKENTREKKEGGIKDKDKDTLDYTISGYSKFLDKEGNPAISPPWGTLNAIDLNTGEYLWKKVFGEYPELAAKGIPQTGAESYGGPVITASGLLFIAGTKDGKFRAYNKKTGDLLWETKLPAPAFATPSTYEVNGKQFIVMACGGNKLGAPKGESYIAFALPDINKE